MSFAEHISICGGNQEANWTETFTIVSELQGNETVDTSILISGSTLSSRIQITLNSGEGSEGGSVFMWLVQMDKGSMIRCCYLDEGGMIKEKKIKSHPKLETEILESSTHPSILNTTPLGIHAR
jgi:hypothetical protein